MSDEWKVIEDSMIPWRSHCLGVHEGYEYKVMRRKVNAEVKEMKGGVKSIKIDKKYVAHFITDNYRVGDIVSVNIVGAMITAINGDEYTLEMPNSEREEFIDKCYNRCFGVGTTIDYGLMYDAGVRFK